jgi:hypothetical protein
VTEAEMITLLRRRYGRVYTGNGEPLEHVLRARLM